MQTINRWRNWKPQGEKFDESPESEPTKPTKPTPEPAKPTFVGFVGSIPAHIQNFSGQDEKPSPRAETLAQVELLPAEIRQWDDALHTWIQTRCGWRKDSWGSVSSLFIDHIEHAHQTGGMFAPDRETFAAILMALGFQVRDGFVYGLLLRRDADAAQWKPETAKPTPKKRGAQ